MELKDGVKMERKILFLVFLILLVIPLTSAITFNPGTVLNTTSSNSSMTFSFTVNATNLTINPTSIYLKTVSYVRDGEIKTCSFINHTVKNTNLASADFGCTGPSDIAAPPSGGGGSTTTPGPQFDIKILEVESPINLGESFNFMYFVKGVGEINNDVTIDFWIEKNGEIITSGSDVIFMGSNEEKIESTNLFLPSGVDSGIYQFIIKVSYRNIKAEAHRTIELTIKDGKAAIDFLFDIRFLLEDTILTSSDELSAILIFENFGVGATQIGLTFIILDEEENEIYREEENITIETEEVLRKSFKRLNLDAGKYTLILQTLYGANVIDEFRQNFEIEKEYALVTHLKNNWVYYLIGVVIFSLLVCILILIIKLRKKKKSKKTRKKKIQKIIKKKKKPYKSIHQKIEKEVGNL